MLVTLASLAFFTLAQPVLSAPVENNQPRAATSPVSVVLNEDTYINKGLVAFGLIPADFKDSTGNTMGGFGSAIDIKPGTWTQSSSGTFTGTLLVTPDRGYNVYGP
ncbi:hypothetical protein H0H93_003669 [Arthromyces matolae]|nr:hypothetical protein H0H93_003669 [Arthromyces matolae]